MTFGILGSGSWGTAIVKILTDSGNNINWWNRSLKDIEYIRTRKHNPHYLPSAYLDISKIVLSNSPSEVISKSDCIVVVIPSAYAETALKELDKNIFSGKKIISAIKGILPQSNLLLNEYLEKEFNLDIKSYFTILGPCHAEEVASEKLSYLTFSGIDEAAAREIAACFKTPYMNTEVNHDIYGVQYAAVLKNIYAVGAGIAHGLDYGDNFLSVLIANSADEMAGFLRSLGVPNIQVGSIDHHFLSADKKAGKPRQKDENEDDRINYAASVYLGDLLVTCYSLHSRNRAFGNMIGKGYSVKSAQMEMNMVAEGYNASRCMHIINEKIKAEMPIADTIFKILWENLQAAEGFNYIEKTLV